MGPVARYHLLGPVEVVRDGRPVDLGGPKQRAVLAVLLLEAGRVVSTDRLMDAVWGDDHPPSAAASLQAYVSNLRRVLRDDERATSPIVRRMPGYLIDVPSSDIDVAGFVAACDAAQTAVDAADWARAVEAAGHALELWRGPLLEEHADDDWVRLPAAALAERRATCDQNLVVGLLGCGRVSAALVRSRQVLDDEPLAERACWLRMVALHRSSRSAEALDTLRAHTRRMNDELGLDIGPALRDLQGAILRQDAELASWPGGKQDTSTPRVVEPDRPAVDPVAEPSRHPHSGSDLVGRDREVAVIDGVLREALTDGTRWLVLNGVAGIGKSRLAEEAARLWQEQGGRVVRTGCPDDDGVPPWWPVSQVLRELGADPDAALTPPSGTEADVARYAAYERVLGVLCQVAATQPLLLVIEDLHWADTASMRFLIHLTGALQPAGLVVIATVRDGAAPPELRRLLAAVARRPGSRQLTVPPLTSLAVSALAAQVSGQPLAPRQAEQLAGRTGGIPFFVCEYARLPEDERASGTLPVAVRSVLGRRLSGVDPAVLEVLRAAALIGDALDVELLARVTRLDRDELADLLDDAADAHLIVPAPGMGDYAFAHALMRDEVIAGLSGLRRQRLHLRIAEAVGPDAGGDQLVRRAAHLLAALPLADAADAARACQAAALDAEQRWQSDTAAKWWGHALEVFDQHPDPDTDRDDLVVAQVAALARAGREQTVLDVIDAALLDAVRRGRMDSAGRLASTLLRTSGSWPWAAYGDDPAPLLARLAGLDPLAQAHPSAHVRILAALAVGSCYDPDGSVPDALSRQALELAEQLDDDEALADALLGRALTFSAIAERAEESLQLLERLAAVPHRTERIDEVIAHGLLHLAKTNLGDPDAAEHIRLGALGSDALRLPTSRVQFRWAQAQLTQWRGDDIGQAGAMFDQAITAHRATELYEGGVLDVAMLTLRWEQGRLDSPSLDAADPRSVPWAAALAAAARGDALADELIAVEIGRVEPVIWTTHGRLTMLAHAVADRGLVQHVAELRRRLEPVAHCVAIIGQVGVAGPVGLALARICALAGDLDAARQHLATATQVSSRSRGGGALLRCQLLTEQLTAQAGRPVDPSCLRAIADQARRRGMHGVEREAASLLAE